MKKVLSVCLGNICRSPLAQGIAENYIKNNSLDIKVDSAGTGNWHVDEPPYHYAQKVAIDFGIDISNLKARQVKTSDFKTFDLIVGLDKQNVSDLKNLGCENVVKLSNYLDGNPNIPDPYFFDGYDVYDEVFS